MNSEDRTIIDACLAGKTSEFNSLVLKYQDRLFNSILRVTNNKDDAADVVQESFVNAFQSLKSFKGDSEFFTWLYRIAFNAAISQKRKKRPANRSESRSDSESEIETGLRSGRNYYSDSAHYAVDESWDSQPHQPLERKEVERQLHQAIAKLSEDHKTVIVLRDIDGLSYDDLAVVLNVPIGTVRSRLNRARLELRAILEEDEIDD